MKPAFHLAQINIATLRAPLTDPLLHGFTSRLEHINALADKAPGFVWRLQTEEGDATALRPYEDDRVLVNLSVWQTPEALKAYVYQGEHVQLVRQRMTWFHRPTGPIYALWWIAADTLPTAAEGQRRLEMLKARGDTPEAFSFARVFDTPAPIPTF